MQSLILTNPRVLLRNNYMGRQIRRSKEKTMKPNFFVFCEGESEGADVKFLRTQYRVPIQLISKKSDPNIALRYINNCKKEYMTTDNEKTFLMFDLHVSGTLERLQCIHNAILLVSNPCIELWFLLHCLDHHAELTSKACIKKFQTISPHYTKGTLSQQEKQILAANTNNAVVRAKLLTAHDNPSTTIYELIDALNNI